ncbi:MAG: hypothetical protein EYC70_00710 [Planctomycetota bacterium]|nr:MAG: hypothetical protein EYC70_00710 [Planctomycetota bacterium]
MKPLHFALPLVLGLLAACDDGGGVRRSKPAETLKPGAAAQGIEGPVEAPPELGAAAANQTLYVCWIKDGQGRPVARARTMLLRAVPDPLYMREPTVKERMSIYVTPKHGRVHHACEADGQVKYMWIAGDGIEPFLTELEPASGGRTFERTITVNILPVATLVVKDFEGKLVPEALLTIRKDASEPTIGNTWNADDSGQLKYTREPGTYILEASKPNGTCYKKITWEWNGDPAPIEIQLPEKSIR